MHLLILGTVCRHEKLQQFFIRRKPFKRLVNAVSSVADWKTPKKIIALFRSIKVRGIKKQHEQIL